MPVEITLKTRGVLSGHPGPGFAAALPDKSAALEERESERELILRCQKGDRNAFEALYLRHHRGLFLFLFSMLRCRHSAEDVAQDVFVKLFEEIRSFRFQCSFGHWLFRVGRNAAIDRIRHEKLRRAASLDKENPEGLSLKDQLADPAPLPSAKAENDERASWVGRELSRLPKYARTVLVLREWEDLNYQEISEKLRVSIGTVKSRIFRGRRMLARRLAENGYPF